jgi:hypothetical protein
MSQGGRLSCTDITRANVYVWLATIGKGAKNVLMIYDTIVTISTIFPSVTAGPVIFETRQSWYWLGDGWE